MATFFGDDSSAWSGGNSSGGGKDFLSSLGKWGSAISPWAPVVGLGLNLLGGLFDDSDEEAAKLEKEKLALERQRLKEQKYEFGRTASFKGLDLLAQNRAEANASSRRYNYNNALFSAMRGQA